MATRDRVTAVMYLRLDRDNRIVLMEVGPDWPNRRMSDFYLIEKQVDRAMIQVMKGCFENSYTDLPELKWRELTSRVTGSTLIKDAIEICFDISQFEVPFADLVA